MTLFSSSYIAKNRSEFLTSFGSKMKPFASSAIIHKIIDVLIIVSTFTLALYLRLGYLPSAVNSNAVPAYFIASTIAGLAFWRVSGLHKNALAFANWRDLGLICGLALIAPIAGILFGFLIDRLNSVPRSLPLYHGALLLFGLSGFRVFVLLIENWGVSSARRNVDIRTDVLLLGHTDLAGVYAQTAQAHGAHHLNIAGILTDEGIAVGTLINSIGVLGKSSDLQAVVRLLGVHGVHISRLVLLLPQREFEKDTERFLQSRNIEVQNFYQALIPSDAVG